MTEKEQWYTNKELFEMVQGLKEDMQAMSQELKQTREIVARYNGLRQQIEECSRKILAIENRAAGQSAVGRAIREWGGWIFGLVSLGVTLYKLGGM